MEVENIDRKRISWLASFGEVYVEKFLGIDQLNAPAERARDLQMEKLVELVKSRIPDKTGAVSKADIILFLYEDEHEVKEIARRCCTSTEYVLRVLRGCGKVEKPGRPGRQGGRNSKRVVQTTLTGEFVAEYESTVQAAVVTGFSRSTIGHVCSGRQSKTGGFKFYYKADLPACAHGAAA